MATATQSRNPLFPGPTWTSFRFIDEEVTNDQFRHYLDLTHHGMADIGECLEVARQIGGNDEESWLRAWTDMAQRIQARAEQSDRRKKPVSAASAYLRASTYYRASLMHFSFPEEPRIREYSLAGKRCYDRYLELSGYPGEYVEIPYEGSFLPAYFYRSPQARGKAPVLLFNQGRDAWPEDTRWIYDGAIRRGIHCLAFHGGGQGLALRLNNLPFRHDWEKVVTPVVDYALGIDGVDAARVALMGVSFGGYLAPRAAAFEKRIKVCIANPGVLSWGGSILAHFPPELRQAFDAGPEPFNAMIAAARGQMPIRDWFIRDSQWKHGVNNPYDLFSELVKCDNTEVAGQISCEMLIMEGTEEIRSEGESQRLYDALKCPKHMMVFDESTTAQLHCQGGAVATAAEMMYDWLDERL